MAFPIQKKGKLTKIRALFFELLLPNFCYLIYNVIFNNQYPQLIHLKGMNKGF